MHIFATAVHVGLENHMLQNMLAAYYSKGASSEEMFSKLDIGKTPDFKRHLNKYDVMPY